MNRTFMYLLSGLLLTVLLNQNALAGQTCTKKAPTPDMVQKAMRLAIKSRAALEKSGAHLALIERVGRDLSKYGLRYSHVGFIWREHPQGRWLVVHLLNHCGTADSGLFDEGLGNFFLDDMFAYETLLVIPSPEAQQKLIAMLKNPESVALHERKYSLIASPAATRYENSNQWTLEVTAAALAPAGVVKNRADAQRWLQDNAYVPDRLPVSPLERLGSTLFKANVKFDDHPLKERLSGRYEVVTAESVSRFMQKIDPATVQRVLRE